MGQSQLFETRINAFASAEVLSGSKSPSQMKRENEWPLVLSAAYLDGGNERPGLAVAGYSGAIDTWWSLNCHWQALLKRWNLKYFKASECENGLVEFAQYRDDLTGPKSPLKPHERGRLRKVKLEFIDAISARHHVLQGYGAAIATEDLKRIFAEDPAAPIIFLNKPYYIGAELCLVAATMLVSDVNMRCSRNDKIKVRPILGAREECGVITNTVFDKFAKKNPRSAEVLLPPQYDDHGNNSWLQVADMLAYEICTQLLNHSRDDYMRVSLRTLLPAMHRVFRLDCKNLKQIIHNYSADSIPVRHLLPQQLWHG